MATQDERLVAIAAAAAATLRHVPYHVVRAGDVAAAVRLPGETGRSAVWLYNEVRNRRVLVALAAAHAWREFPGRVNAAPPGLIQSVTAARSAAAAALGVIVAFHRAEQAGLPLRGRRCLEEAAESRRGRFLPASYRAQEDLLWLVRAALVLERPMLAIDLLADEAAPTDWFCDRVSFRLGYTARRLLALASGALGRTGEAAAALQADREQLSDRPLCIGLDPLVADFDRAIGEVALLRGDFAGALTTLAKLAEAEAEGPAPLPTRGWTLVLLGRAADRLGDSRRAAGCFSSVADLVSDGIDPGHPVILTARYDQAVRCAATGDTGESEDLLGPVLDRTPQAHGYPALGDAHPLLARARALAQRLGIPVPDTTTGPDDASLDIDI